MCERKTNKYVCNRCSNFIYIGKPRETVCQRKLSDKVCGRLEHIEIVKCEPALCTRCAAFPNCHLSFTGKPDISPTSEHNVVRNFKSFMNKKPKDLYIRESTIQKTRKTYLAGAIDPAQEERNFILNQMLSCRLKRPIELMKIKGPAEEATKEANEEAKQETQDKSKTEPKEKAKEETEKKESEDDANK
ncbi:hypothetical protein FPOA_07042 [Fusarium poae]|uniref:Uncharacterized protein n=1 Tax=Fusarium poae TaxID=36050 RepID=A0A1B8AJE6_FUSPO|nr:hypothetical protein FPOA_07042 [Fusarium poae]